MSDQAGKGKQVPGAYVAAAKRLLADLLGTELELPKPSTLPTISLPAQASTNSRRAAKRAQLRQIAIAYALFVLIQVSGRKKEYYAELKKQHELARADGDKIGWILRSVIPLPAEGPKQRSHARHAYSAWAKAIRFCMRKCI